MITKALSDFLPNPTDLQIELVKVTQAIRLTELNKLPIWSDSEFDEALECSKVWWPIEKEWQPTGTSLYELITNPRVPASKMARMKEAYSRIVNSKSFLSERQN